jgi:ABC transporter substrate binding protein
MQRQLGNAVPSLIAEILAREIRAHPNNAKLARSELLLVRRPYTPCVMLDVTVKEAINGPLLGIAHKNPIGRFACFLGDIVFCFTAFASLAQRRPDALLVSPGPLFGNRRVQLATLTARHLMPAMYYDREFAEVGGLMSYGTSLVDQYRQTGIYVGRVLKGEKPPEMPILRATKFELVINLQTAKVIGIEVPSTLLARADEVIE